MSAHLDPGNLSAGEMVDGWRVVRRLGGGGYGTTYQVEKGGAFFALKLAHHRAQSGDERETDERTQREIACLLSLRHRHIVRVWGHGRWPHPKEGWLYFLMDYVEGATLSRWQEQARPTPHEVVVLVEKVLEALATMHAQGILHRDLKPDNLMVDKDGEPVVVDYGAAHSPAAPRLTKHPLPPGTPRYTSPEAARFEWEHRRDKAARYQYTVADELYALGVTLYDVLTDPLPHSHPQPLPVGGPVPPASAHDVNERVPAALSSFTAKLLSLEPEQRPESAERARKDITELVSLDTEEWRKRPFHPPPPVAVPTLAPSVEAPAPAARRQAPGSTSLRRRQWRLMGVGVGLCVLAASGAALALLARSTPPTRPTAEPSPSTPVTARLGPEPAPAPPPPSPSPSPQEKGPPVKARSTPSTSAPAVCSGKEPPPHGTAAWRAWCQCAGIVGTLVAFQAGCTGPQVRPASEPCPQEARDAAKELDDLDGGGVCIDQSQLCDADTHHIRPWIKEGPVTGRLFALGSDQNQALIGALFFGEVRITDAAKGEATVRYTLVQLPDGKKYPICMEGEFGNGVAAKAGAVQATGAITNGHIHDNWEYPW